MSTPDKLCSVCGKRPAEKEGLCGHCLQDLYEEREVEHIEFY